MTSTTHNADCFDVIHTLEKNSIDFVCVDLPYGQTSNKWDSVIDLDKMWVELKKCCKDNCIYAFFTTTRFGFKLIESNKKWFRYDVVMKKNTNAGFLHAKRMPMRKHELIYVFYKKTGTYNPQMTQGKPYHRDSCGTTTSNYNQTPVASNNPSGLRYPISIIETKRGNYKSQHPTQKPLDILEWLVKTYSNEGDTVLDYTMGSGSAGVASIKLNRNFIGIELEKEYFDVANDRINNIAKD